ncbi:hypothetical protein BXY39_2343 [Eilatimonas milleporae]|uniref:Uncharacterized protein n=2 Tax=Eilatimonas milleporae TaxID=911205 RepID=A0A3M0CCP4_9PROT|nr:hypothetical protein BXY39_2343 [Eilatimonas milleporae]
MYPERPQRVAVCLAGQMRNFHLCYEALHRYIIAPLNADVFLHTWPESGAPEWEKNDRLLLHRIENNGKRQIFATDGHHVPLEHIQISPALIEALYQPARYIVGLANDEDSRNVGIDRIPQILRELEPRWVAGMLPSLYTQYVANDLKRRHEAQAGFKYDIVIRTCPDMLFLSPLPEKLFTGPETLWVFDHEIDPAFQASVKMVCAPSSVMDIYCDSFLHVDRHFEGFLRRSETETVPVTERPIGERLLYQHAKHRGLTLDSFSMAAKILRQKTIPLSGTWRASTSSTRES